VVDLVRGAEVIVREADREEVPRLLNALGRHNLSLIRRTMEFLADTKLLLDTAEANVAREEANRSQVDPAVLVNEIAELLSRVVAAVPAKLEAAQ
jgi:hypothetical protein